MPSTAEISGLNEVQQSLLRMFNRGMSLEESLEIRKLLFDHYSNKLFEEVERVVDEKGITEADYERLRNEHHRTKSSSK